jgi:hypothetical protein
MDVDGSSESGPLEMARLYLHEVDTDTKNGYRLMVVGHVHVHI